MMEQGKEKKVDIKKRIFKDTQGFLDVSVGKESSCNVGDTGDLDLITGWGRYTGGGNGNPFQYSCLQNLMDRGALQATVHGVTKSQTQLSD